MSKLARLKNTQLEPHREQYVFECPGCGALHRIWVTGDHPVWTWNGSFDAPTFSPSLLICPDEPKWRCHSFIQEGKIQFLSDCHHELAGQTVELPELDFTEI